MYELTLTRPEFDEKSYNLSLSILSKVTELTADEIKSQKEHLTKTKETQSLDQSLEYISTQTTLRSILEKNFQAPELNAYFESVKPMLISLGIIGDYLMMVKKEPESRGKNTPPYTDDGWDIGQEKEKEIISKMELVEDQANLLLNGKTFLYDKNYIVEHFPELLIEVCRQKVASVTE